MQTELTEWAPALFDSVASLSRTTKGVTEAAYNGQKPPLRITDPDALREKAGANLRHAIVHVWVHGRAVRTHPTHVAGFMNAVATKVSEGLLQPWQSLFRTWDTRGLYPRHVAVDQIVPAMHQASVDIASALQDRPAFQKDPVRTAALLEHRLDRIHPYADGCGRTIMLLGAWILLRADYPPAHFSTREEYYEGIRKSSGEWEAIYRSHLPVHNSV